MYQGSLPWFKRDHRFDVDLQCIGSEDVVLEENSVDVAFTSPPYFSLELYSDEPTQSHVKYPTFPQWRDGFLKETLMRTFRAVKPGCYFCINIAGNKMLESCGVYLEKAVCDVAKDLTYTSVETLLAAGKDGVTYKVRGGEVGMNLMLLKSGVDTSASGIGEPLKGEPVFVFQKVVA